jgi:uncharacterized protein
VRGLAVTLAVVAAIVVAALPSCTRGPKVVIIAPGGETRAAVDIEIADTPTQRELGLMYRGHLDASAGMLFVFPASSVQRFWMKNTKIPLDMIFADERGKIVGIVADARPYSETPVGPDAPAEYVLEVNAGFCRNHGVTVGDKLEFRGFAPSASQ